MGNRENEEANVHVTNGVKGHRVIILRASDSYCHGTLMR